MNHFIVSARKYRPQSFRDVVGQQAITNTLLNAIENNHLAQALLFTGPRGVGKTTCARILAKKINEQTSGVEDENDFAFNVFELDAASNNSVDDIRKLIEQVRIPPQVGKYKVYIIDEVHMLSTAAFNAFLKTLEEPPEKTLIILTANSLDNFLPTITSRTQIIEVKNIDDEAIKNQLKKQNIDEITIQNIIFQAQGNWNNVLKILSSQNIENKFEEHFIKWVRYAFNAKTKPQYLKEILLWADDTSSWNRETQKQFLNYASEIFRLALLENYTAQSLVYKKLKINNFKWDSFSKFINGINIQNILEEISEANNHITRNGNAKIIWTDLGIKLTRFLHKKN